jgi:hypothetical protein
MNLTNRALESKELYTHTYRVRTQGLLTNFAEN